MESPSARGTHAATLVSRPARGSLLFHILLRHLAMCSEEVVGKEAGKKGEEDPGEPMKTLAEDFVVRLGFFESF